MELISQLVESLGISEEQATGGAGGLLGAVGGSRLPWGSVAIG